MFFTNWEFKENNYFELIVSLHEEFAPILIVQVKPVEDNTLFVKNNQLFEVVVRDHKTGLMLSSKKCASLEDARIKAKQLASTTIIDFCAENH